jgi:perosamine synthetase
MSRESLPEAIVAAVRKTLGEGRFMLHEPRFKGREKEYLNECIDSTFVSSVGPFVDRFERELASYTGADHAVAVVNGTAALHVSLLLAGVLPGDEVLIPALTFVATANAVAYCGATPHFADSDETTLGMCPSALRAHLASVSERRGGLCVNRHTGRVIRAMVPMHTFGHPCDIDGLLSISGDFDIPMVEDAAESLGSHYHGRHTGTFGLLATLSFNGNKTITTGGGGAILTNDRVLAQKAKHLTTTAKKPHPWDFVHDQTGYNYRLPNLNAALGCAQLEQMPEFLASKRRLYSAYRDSFEGVIGVRLMTEPEGCISNYWLQTLLLEEAEMALRDRVLQATNDAGIMTRPSWRLMSRLDMYRDCPSAPLPVAESLERRLINIPSSVRV